MRSILCPVLAAILLTACRDDGSSRSTADDDGWAEEASTGAETPSEETGSTEPATVSSPVDEADLASSNEGPGPTGQELCASATDEDIPVVQLEHRQPDTTRFECGRCGARYFLPSRIEDPARMRCRYCCAHMVLNVPEP